MTVQPHLPEPLAAWMGPFLAGLTRPTWRHALVLVAGAILAPGRRTVAAMLRVVGLGQAPTFTNYHRVLNRNRWSGRAAAKRLLHLLLAAFAPDGPVVIGIDETIERRWGARIRARGIYRDPVRSSRGHFVKASGLRWISVMLLAPIPWAGRVWALPFLTALAPSERFAREHGPPPQEADRPGAPAPAPGRPLAARAAADRGRRQQLRRHRAARGRLPPPHRGHPAPARRPAVRPAPAAPAGHHAAGRGCRARASPPWPSAWPIPRTRWRRVTVAGWYGRTERRIELISGTALWYHPGKRVPIRWLLVRDVAGEFEPQGFLCTDPDADPLDVLRWFVRRWSVEVTFAEVRRHLGVETPAAVVGPGDRAHHAGAARPVLAGDALGRGRARRRCPAPTRRLVSQAPAHLQRRARRRPLPPLDLGDFLHLTGATARSPKSPVRCWSGSPRPPATRPEWPKSSSFAICLIRPVPLARTIAQIAHRLAR